MNSKAKAISKRLAALIIAAIIIVAGIGGVYYYFSLSRSTTAGPLKIGFLADFTGAGARGGEIQKKAGEMVLQDAYDQGILPLTIDGKKRDVQWVWVDEMSGDPEGALRNVVNAIEVEKVDMMFNGAHSSTAMSLKEETTKYGMIHFAHQGASSTISHYLTDNPDTTKYFFKAYPAPEFLEAGLYGQAFAYLLDQGQWNPPNNKMAICAEDTDWGRAWAPLMQKTMGDLGWTTVYLDYVSTNPVETDYYPYITKYNAAGVSLIAYTMNNLPGPSAFVKQVKEMGTTALIIPHLLSWYGDYVALVGDAGDYCVVMDKPEVVDQAQRDWIADFNARYNEAGQPNYGMVYDLAMMMFQVLNQAGTMKADTIAQTIYATTYHGIFQTYKFAESTTETTYRNELIAGRDYYFFPMVQWLGNQTNIVWPPDMATATFVQPPWQK